MAEAAATIQLEPLELLEQESQEAYLALVVTEARATQEV
jgi:hypothetical protein